MKEEKTGGSYQQQYACEDTVRSSAAWLGRAQAWSSVPPATNVARYAVKNNNNFLHLNNDDLYMHSKACLNNFEIGALQFEISQ